MNSVANIKSLVHEGLASEAVKIGLKKLGPPRPAFETVRQISHQRSYRVFTEKFNTEFYKLAEWLCGCPQRNALFCYICLVMSDKYEDKYSGDLYYWIMFGVTSEITLEQTLITKITEHQVTSHHMKCSLDYALLGENNVLHHLRNEFFLSVTQHNEKVRPNRYILSKLIDCVKCTTGESDYKTEMMQVLKDSGSLVSGIFQDSFESMQNELLESIHAVCVKLIQEEIGRSDFVSLEVNEVNSVGPPVKLVFIVRYELRGEVHERFLKYVVTQSNHSWNLANIILSELNQLSVINKKPDNIISFSYDGLISVFASRWGLHSKIKGHFKKIYFIHSYAHNIDFVIENTGSLYRELRVFFINLKNFRAFFSRSANYINILDAVVAKRLNGEFKTEWNFQATSPTVITLCSHKGDLHECLDQIIELEVERSTIAEAVSLKNLLNNLDFNYWLDFFSKVMPVCDELFYQIQQLKAFDAVQVRTIVENFKTEMMFVKNCIGQNGEVNPPPNKKPCIKQVHIKEEFNEAIVLEVEGVPLQDLSNVTRTEMANNVFNVIMAYIEERVTPSPYLLLASLIHPGFFSQYGLAFPRAEVEQAAKIFSFDKEALAVELQIIYGREEFVKADGALFILQYFYENHLNDIFPETFKLLKMVCTVPMTTSEPGRCFDTLKQIKRFLKSSYGQNKSDVLTMCWLGKELMKTTNFNEMVIEHLCRHHKGGMDFSGFMYLQLY